MCVCVMHLYYIYIHIYIALMNIAQHGTEHVSDTHITVSTIMYEPSCIYIYIYIYTHTHVCIML